MTHWNTYGGKRNNSKYGAEKTEIDGIKFDSKKEARRYRQLSLLQSAGIIQDLRRQVRFELVPAQYEGDKCVERSVVYVADFVYTETGTGAQIVEDVKGKKTDVYIIKRKLMRYVHGIKIKET